MFGWEDPGVLRARMQELGEEAARVDRARQSVAEVSGRDSTGVVSATVNADADVVGIDIDPGFRRALGPADLGPAILEALRDAIGNQLQAWGEAAARTPVPPPTGSSPAGSSPAAPAGSPETFATELTELAGRLSRQDAARAMRALVELLEEVEQEASTVSRVLRDLPSVRRTARPGPGRVEVTVTGTGEVESLRYDPSWLRSSGAREISAETVKAIASARRVAGRPQAVIDESRLSSLIALSQDSVALSRRIGLL